MLSTQVRQRLKTLLVEISKSEKQIEVLREVLGEQPDFEPYASFRRIDRNRKGHITANDITLFLCELEHNFTEAQCQYFVDRYDTCEDGVLTYNEYL